jgi:hypothetical protein
VVAFELFQPNKKLDGLVLILKTLQKFNILFLVGVLLLLLTTTCHSHISIFFYAISEIIILKTKNARKFCEFCLQEITQRISVHGPDT